MPERGRFFCRKAPATGAGRWLRAIALPVLLLMLPAASAGAAGPPQRVVSMNVCTDQLAMLLAAPGQLVSISHLATDPGSSALARQARDYRLNHSLAEEVFLMQPDLILTGTFSTSATASMLERLGFRVEKFAPETSFDDVRQNILRMGVLLGQEERAGQMADELDAGLRDLAAGAIPGMMAATYASNSYTTGRNSLSEAVIEAAGLANLGSELGIEGSGRLPLEVLVVAMPEILTNDTPTYDAPALAQENFTHPAFRAVRARTRTAAVAPADWICGGPFNLAAATILQEAARAVATEGKHAGK